MLKVGNGRGRLNSVRANLQLMGVAKVPLLCIVGTDDTCEQPLASCLSLLASLTRWGTGVNPNQVELIVDYWAEKECSKKVVLRGEDHGLGSAMEHVRPAIHRMLAEPPAAAPEPEPER